MPTQIATGQLFFVSAPNLDRVSEFFKLVAPQEYRRRSALAVLEASHLVASVAQQVVHVRSGKLRGSISALDVREMGDSVVGVVTASKPYAAIEEMRGQTGAWGDVPFTTVAAGPHSFMARAMVMTQPTVQEIFSRYISGGGK